MRELDRRTAIKVLGVAASVTGVSGLTAARDEGDEAGDEPEIEEWFEDTDGFEDVVDETDADEVEVAVGAGEDGTEFDPAFVRITEGTTVVWEWTGEGGSHDVIHEPDAEAEIFGEENGDGDGNGGGDSDGDDDTENDGNGEDTGDDGAVGVDEDETEAEFVSELTEEEGHTFEHEFEAEDGGRTYLYKCAPHEVNGMRGAIIVDEEDTADENGDDDENGDTDGNANGNDD